MCRTRRRSTSTNPVVLTFFCFGAMPSYHFFFPSPFMSKAIEHACCLAVLALSAGVYLRTLHPSVAGGDSGELMITSLDLATPHPPGYPTFAMLTHFLGYGMDSILNSIGVDTSTPPPAFVNSLTPAGGGGGIAFAMNVVHGCFSVATVVCLYWSVVISGGSVFGGVLAATVFGFSPNVWTYAIGTEVFPLNNLFSAGLLMLCAVFDKRLRSEHSNERDTLRFVHMAALFCGLSLTNQHTSILFVCPVVLWVFYRFPPCWKTPRQLGINTACFFAGLAPYIYIPLSNLLVSSPHSWGRSITVSDFMRHFLRMEYGTFSLASQEAAYRDSNFGRNSKYFLADMVHQMGIVPLALVCISVWALLAPTINRRLRSPPVNAKKISSKPEASKKKEKSAVGAGTVPALLPSPASSSLQVALLLTWLAYVNFFNHFSNLPIEQPLFYGVQQRFWIQPLLIAAFMAGHGLKHSLDFIATVSPSIPVGALGCALVGILACWQIGTNFAEHDESTNYYIRDYGYTILNPLPAGSVLLTKGDLVINSVRFVQSFDHFRQDDVLVLDQEMMTYAWYISNIRDWIALRKSRATSQGCGAFVNKSQSYPAECETSPDAVFSRHFSDWRFPAAAYYPGRDNCFSMVELLRANTANGRRFFASLGFKEGDPTSDRLFTRAFGLSQEILQSHNVALQQTDPLYQTADIASSIKRMLRQPPELAVKPSVETDKRASLHSAGTAPQIVGIVDPSTLISIGRSLPDSVSAWGVEPSTGTHLRLPPNGRYASHTWEAVVVNDVQQAYFNTGLAFMSFTNFISEYITQKSSDPKYIKACIRALVGSIATHKQQSNANSALAVLDLGSGFASRIESLPAFLVAPMYGSRLLDVVIRKFNNTKMQYNACRNKAVTYQHLSDIASTFLKAATAQDKAVLTAFKSEVVQQLLIPAYVKLREFPEHETLSYSQLEGVIEYYAAAAFV